MRENCGLYGGVYPNVASEICRGLIALQHRGQESAGISIVHNRRLITIKNSGLVREALPLSKIQDLKGDLGIGHVRYSTAGGTNPINAQPIEVEFMGAKVALAHNGNIENYRELRTRMERRGKVFLTGSDTEIFLHRLVEHFCSPPSMWDPLEVAKVVFEIKGAYSLLFLFGDKVIAIRDPNGYRPLWIRRQGDSILFSSEDAAFPEGGERLEMEPGSLAVAGRTGFTYQRVVVSKPRQCVFEYIYFARPDSRIFGHNVYEIREKLGERCAEEHPVNAEVVIPVMDSGLAAAIGFSRKSGIPLEPGLMRNPWIGRTFIEPFKRAEAVKEKLSTVAGLIRGKKIVLVDDSIVRGTTLKKIIEIVKMAGPREIHFRVASPPITHECFWGIDIPSRKQLIAKNGVEEVKKRTGVDSLGYLSLEGMRQVLGDHDEFCFYCFTGRREV